MQATKNRKETRNYATTFGPLDDSISLNIRTSQTRKIMQEREKDYQLQMDVPFGCYDFHTLAEVRHFITDLLTDDGASFTGICLVNAIRNTYGMHKLATKLVRCDDMHDCFRFRSPRLTFTRMCEVYGSDQLFARCEGYLVLHDLLCIAYDREDLRDSALSGAADIYSALLEVLGDEDSQDLTVERFHDRLASCLSDVDGIKHLDARKLYGIMREGEDLA